MTVAVVFAVSFVIVALAADGQPPRVTESPTSFSDRTVESGVLAPLEGMMGHGAAWGDFDGDGRIDLYVGGFCDRPNAEYNPADSPVPNRLLRNLGDGRFEIVQQPAVSFHGRTSGAVFADLDNNSGVAANQTLLVEEPDGSETTWPSITKNGGQEN
jgi:hypothetical protein